MRPLQQKSYGSIPHLPGSRNYPATGDRELPLNQAAICLTKPRDKHDNIIVQEKLDGSNVAVANVNGEIVPISRSGYAAISSPYLQHIWFHNWVIERIDLFKKLITPGERICGEWLALAHGTIYKLPHDPFVAFDIMRNGYERATWDEFKARIGDYLVLPHTLSVGPPISVKKALSLLNPVIHGAQEEIEGCVWRVERQGKVDFLAKYVRPSKIDGKYFSEVTGKPEIYNWQPVK